MHFTLVLDHELIDSIPHSLPHAMLPSGVDRQTPSQGGMDFSVPGIGSVLGR